MALGIIAVMLYSAPVLFGADETCTKCGQAVSVSGEFSHYKADQSVVIEGAGGNAAAFHEEIYGNHFSITIAHLPAGQYTIAIGEAEVFATAPRQRIFSVTAGKVTLATNFDIFTAAGGAKKICYITGTVDHADDSLQGPLQVSFSAAVENAKFNTFEVKNAAGASVVEFTASELADPYTAAASRIPEISTPPIWRDPSHSLKERADDLIRRMSLAEKVSQLMNSAPAIPRLGLPAYGYWSEGLHGVGFAGDATVFPQAIGAAATWDPALLQREAHVIGVEGRAKFNDYASKHNGDSKDCFGLTFWSPNINIFRDPRWGRGQETYGEDPFLSGTMGVAFIKGLQGNNPNYMLAMACAKHFAVHSGPESQRRHFNAVPPERDLYETYLPQFEMAVREGHVGGVMGAYSSLFGVPCCASKFLLTDILRKQWGFNGYVVSDCCAILFVWQEHHYLATPEEAATAAMEAGCNLCCGVDYNALVRAVQKGMVSEKTINGALYHVLWTRFRLGLLDPPENVPFSKITIKDNDTPEHEALALKVAEESVVLLKNEGVLPLERSKLKRIAVIGPNADSVDVLCGNYSGNPTRPVTILNGIRQLAGPGLEVTYAAGCPPALLKDGSNKPAPAALDDAVAKARAADVVIFVGGINGGQLETEEGDVDTNYVGFLKGDRTRIELPSVQTDLLKLLTATGKPVILVNCSGSAMAIPWEVKHLPAILQAWYPGERGGRAVAEILFGDVNPGGHLPLTFYTSTTDLPAFTDYSMANRTYRYFGGTPEFAFGHGLSYTQFQFTKGKLEWEKISAGRVAKISFALKNTGQRDGDEVAQVYFRHVNSAVPQPKCALCGFARVHLKSGEAQKITIEIPAARLRYWDTQANQYVVEAGKYEFLLGAASDDIRLKLPAIITTP